MSGFNQQPGIGSKNPPWARPAAPAAAIPPNAVNLYQQLAQAQLQLQQANISVFNPMNTVRYPAQATSVFTSCTSSVPVLSNSPTQSSSNNKPNSTSSVPAQKTRVFTGVVTRKQENFGFIDDDVFFRSTAVQGMEPMIGESVLVEATYNESMPFKWNATRVQTINLNRLNNPSSRFNESSNYSTAPPSTGLNGNSRDLRSSKDRYSPDKALSDRRNENDMRRFDRDRHSRERDLERRNSRDNRRSRHSMEKDKTGKEKERDRDRSRNSPVYNRSKISPRRHVKIPPRYMVQVPKIALDLPEVDVLELRRRYPNMYIPSDFFLGEVRWVDQFPPHRPFTMNQPCNFHILRKETDPVYENDAVLDPPDVDYLYSAKVMLMSMPSLEDIYKKCISLAEDSDKEEADNLVHPSRLLNFLVGVRGKNEAMAIGGPWSPSLDGPNPDKDPSVLIKTAIRTCKALTGIDLSNCTHWYRFVEVHYQRSDTLHKGKQIPARVETVVLFLPDVWSCIPTQVEWEKIKDDYKQFVKSRLDPEKKAEPEADSSKSLISTPKPAETDKETDQEVESDFGSNSEKPEPTHFLQLDPKTMKAQELRDELEARNLSPKGLKYQLAARLTKVLKAEEEKETKKKEEDKTTETSNEDETKKELDEDWTVVESWNAADEKSSFEVDDDEDKKKETERLKAVLEKRYALPDSPQIIALPSRVAKSGKFECTVMSLSLLLDYRPDDNKEHLFEISLFAEFFNEMLMRDFGFLIYLALHNAPAKAKEDDKKKDDKKKDEKEDKKKPDDKSVAIEESKKEKKKDKIKHFTENKPLLLAFIYFDTTHCGYILDRDLEDLLFSLGLRFSRSQVKKLVAKVISRDSLTYRKLTDKPLELKSEKAVDASNKEDSSDAETLIKLSLGNKRKLAVSDSSSPPQKLAKPNESESNELESNSEFVYYKGSLVNIERISSQLKRSEKARMETENQLSKLKSDFSELEKSFVKSNEKIEIYTTEAKHFADKIAAMNTMSSSLKTQNEKLTEVVHQVHQLVNPFISSALDKSNDSKEKLNETNSFDVKIENK